VSNKILKERKILLFPFASNRSRRSSSFQHEKEKNEKRKKWPRRR
jgi:hypothetical protein